MGDRSNIVIRDHKDSQIFLYGHWMGPAYVEILKKALKRAEDKWDDSAYIARVIFCDMVKDDIEGTTGYGISAHANDNEYPYLVLDCKNQKVNMETEKGRVLLENSIADFIQDSSGYLKVLDID